MNSMKHKHNHYREASRQLRFGIILNAAFSAMEFIGGVFANSLALITNAVHDLTDAVSLFLAWIANKKAQKSPDIFRTFGYQRATILAAFINAVILVLVTVGIYWRAYLKILNPEPVRGGSIFLIAVLGVIVNSVIARMFGKHKKDAGMKVIWWHFIGDVLSWIGVITVAIVVVSTGWYIIDPIASFFIGLVVLYGAWGVIKDTINVLLEGAPLGIATEEVIKELKSLPEIKGVHDLHIWSLDSKKNICSGHITIDDRRVSETSDVLKKIENLLKNKFNITHITIELECEKCKRGAE